MFVPQLKNTLLLKNANHHPSLQQVIIFLVEGLTSMVICPNLSLWWLLNVGVIVTVS